MSKLSLFILTLVFSVSAWADVDLSPLLSKVTFQLQAEQWLVTKTALVNVGVNAAVTDQGINQVQAEVMQKLNQFSNKGEWHIVSFDRQLDKLGLETIQIVAQARLPQTELANLRSQAKAISKPGETFTVDNVQFTPSDDETRAANAVLRNTIYQQAKAEIDTLNKTYVDQKYYLQQIDFTFQAPVEPMPMLQTAMASNAAVLKTAPPLSVGSKLKLQAMVVLAAMPDQVTQKLSHI